MELDNKRDKLNKIIKFIVIIFLIILLIVLQILMAEKLQDLEYDASYDKPYFITYFMHSFYIIFIPIAFALDVIIYFSYKKIYDWKTKKKTLIKILKYGSIFGIILFFVTYFWLISIPMISVSANMAILYSQCAFVFIFSIFLIKEKVTILKILAVLFCIAGVLMIAFGRHNKNHPNFSLNKLGYLFASLSMILNSFYQVLYKRIFKNEDESTNNKYGLNNNLDDNSINETTSLIKKKRKNLYTKLNKISNSMYVIGMIGVTTLLLFWTGIPILNKIGMEKFIIPKKNQLIKILINSCIESSFNTILLIAIILSTPTFVAIGLLLIVPTSVVVDKIFNNYLMSTVPIIGVALIIIGFLINIIGKIKQKKNNYK